MGVDLYFNNKHKKVQPGETLFDYADTLGIRVPTSCSKQGICKECLVEITEGMEYLSERSKREDHLSGEFRLSCQCRIEAASGVVQCLTMRRGEMVIEAHALNLPNRQKLIPEPAITRKGNTIVRDGEVLAESEGPIYGIAMDLGTTTVVIRLIDLESGTIIADSSFENPQRFGGSEVMARIRYDTDHRDRVLQKTLAGYVTHAIEDFGVDVNAIYEMVVVGNSTMRDIFFGLNVYTIGQNPYQSKTEIDMANGKLSSTSLSAPASRVLLNLHPKARVYGLPVISGHVGADAAACMLAVDLAHEDELVAIMDIGTNTELIVGNRHKILAASCPAGPAFEGGKINCGMPGLPGAIEKVFIDKHGSFINSVIGNVEPEGICGSGLIDLMSELLRTGNMNSLGRFEEQDEEFVLYRNGKKKIFFSESDINELAQAKGANVAGLHTVFNEYGIRFGDIDKFYLAGGFGRHINIESAKRIGLIPNIDSGKIIQVGNASIEGASIALLSVSKRMEVEDMVRNITHCRLETHPDFFNYFVEGCQFNPVNNLDTANSD
jgi:uncharacterized 2Fe-2S/4Fe-4S cluster protein (DUF4445 family)